MSFPSDIKSLYSSTVKWVRRPGTAGEWVNVASPSIFTVAGNVRVTVFYGIVTTLFDGGATTLQPRLTPTAGAAVAQVLSLASGSLAAAVVGTTIVPTGAVGGACTVETTLGVTVGNLTGNEITLIPGIIDVLVAGATNTDGVLDWVIGYIPLENGAVITIL